jgi:hypothetical protein
VADRDRGTGTIEVARFRYRHEAEMAAGTLADAGIPAVVVGDDAGGMYPGIMFVAVRVAAENVENARAVLGPDD